MLENILNVEGVNQLDRNQQVTVKGGGELYALGGGCYPNGTTRPTCH